MRGMKAWRGKARDGRGWGGAAARGVAGRGGGKVVRGLRV